MIGYLPLTIGAVLFMAGTNDTAVLGRISSGSPLRTHRLYQQAVAVSGLFVVSGGTLMLYGLKTLASAAF